MYLHACANYPKRIGGGCGYVGLHMYHYVIVSVNKIDYCGDVEWYGIWLAYNGTSMTLGLKIYNSTMYPCLDNRTFVFNETFKPCYWRNNTIVAECANCYIKLFDDCLIYHGFYYAGIPYSFDVVNGTCCIVLLNTDVLSIRVYLYQDKCTLYFYGWCFSGKDICDGTMQVQGHTFVYEEEYSSEDDAYTYGIAVVRDLKAYDYAYNTLKVTPPADLCEQIKNVITLPFTEKEIEEGEAVSPTKASLATEDIEQNDYTLSQLKDEIADGIADAYEEIAGTDETPFPVNLELDENQIKLPENTEAFEAFAYFDDHDCE
jgi:hypothetical protein